MENTQIYFDQLIGVSERLVALLHQENDLLKQRKVTALSDLQQEKAKLGFIYETQMKRLQDNPELVETAAADQKVKLKELAYDFEDAAKTNLKRLKAAHETGGRVLNAIRAAVKEQTNPATGYTAAGATPGTKPTLNGTAMSLDQQL